MTVKAQISRSGRHPCQGGHAGLFHPDRDPDTRYHGTLRTVELAPTNINEQTASTTATSNAAIYYYALFRVPNPGHQLRVAMTTQVTIVLGERKQYWPFPRPPSARRLATTSTRSACSRQGTERDPAASRPA